MEAARRHGVDVRLLRVICFMESRFRLEVVSPKGARGPMQFMPATARTYRINNPHDPRQSMDAAARYLGDLLRKFSGRVDLALAAYNAGEGTVESFITGRSLLFPNGKIVNPRGIVTGGIPPYPETRSYVKRGLNLLNGGSVTNSLVRHTHLQSQSRLVDGNNLTIDALSESEPVSVKFSSQTHSSFISVP